jgi:hypothetical protein
MFFVSRSQNFYGIITYRGPSIDFLSPLELLSIGGTEMTVDGSDFGFEFLSPISIFVCNQICSHATFVSPTSITCLAPPVPQPDYKQLKPVANVRCVVTVLVANSSGSFEGNVTFFRPSISLQSVLPEVAGSGVITVVGSAFGLDNPNPTLRIGSTACLATLWQSWTQLLCYIPQGSGFALDVSVTIFDRSARMVSAFSYPPPKILTVSPPSIPTVGSFITITGSNFGTNQTRIIVYTNGLPCSSPALIALNTISCFAAAGSGNNRIVSVSADDQIATMEALSYNPPSLYSVDPASMPANLVFEVTVTGSSMGVGASSYLLLNFSTGTWPYPIISGCSLLLPHFSAVCSVSTTSFPSEKTENGAVNLTVLIFVDSQASAALPVSILPRSSLAQLIVTVNSRYSPKSICVQLIRLLSAPSSCTFFIHNTTQSNPERRLLSDLVLMNVFLISSHSEFEAQKFMNNLVVLWSSNPKALQSIGIVGATFENELPVFSPPVTSSISTPVQTKSNSLPDWFVPSISVIFGSICFGIISFFLYRRRARRLALGSKRSSQNSSFDESEPTDVENVDEDQDQSDSFVSVEIEGNVASSVQVTHVNSDDEGVGVNLHPLDIQTNCKQFFGVSIDNLAFRHYRGYKIPLIAATLMDFVLNMGGQTTEGIFRLSAPSSETAAARIQIEVRVQVVDSYALFVTLRLQIDGLDCDEAIQKAQYAVDNCVIAAVLLKCWLRELPDSIVPQVIFIVVCTFNVCVFDNFSEPLQPMHSVGF